MIENQDHVRSFNDNKKWENWDQYKDFVADDLVGPMVVRSDTLPSSGQVGGLPDDQFELLESWCERARQRIDQRLGELTEPTQDGCAELSAAMRYSLLAPGKRVRPLLALLTAAHFDRPIEPLIDFGCALELVHCASLILDDLPCMDDARLRRGQPACHIEFDEATASLAAIALLNLASGVIARDQQIDPVTRCDLIDQLSTAVGAGGLVSGQSRDLLERRHELGSERMRTINHQKTGVLFELAVLGSATLIGLEPAKFKPLQHYAMHLGQAFQTADDLLDCSAHAAGSGKDCNADQAKGGSVHALGQQTLKLRLESELAATHAALPRGAGSFAGLPELYLNRLFARFG